MLARPYRFHGYGSLRRTYQNGQTVRGSLVSLRFASRQAGQNYRVAIVVSRKVHKSAVIRNRIRRRIYELVRQSAFVPPATDLVFTVFSDQVATLEAGKLRDLVDGLLKKVVDQPQKTA